jgi:hypothetical protein
MYTPSTIGSCISMFERQEYNSTASMVNTYGSFYIASITDRKRHLYSDYKWVVGLQLYAIRESNI